MRVLIIGAGLGGLCLAHGLRRAGMEAQVYERRPTPADQPASYGIHLNSNGLRALHDCLPSENWEQLIAAAAPARDVIRFWDPQLWTLATHDNEVAARVDPITRRRAVSRGALRDALLLGLDTETKSLADPVQWGREFRSYEHTAQGQIEVCFADGSRAQGDLLVGADGSNSRVRKQRLPLLERTELDVLNVAGRLPLTPKIASQLPKTLTDGSVNNIVPPGSGWMFVSTWLAETGDSERTLVWAWAAHRRSYPANVEQLSPVSLRDHVLGRTERWVPALRNMIAGTSPETIARVPLRTMPTLEAWAPSTVTLLGDAIHNMTPMAGIGANTALRDAAELCRALTRPGQRSTTERVADYEESMRTYANDALAQSTRNALNAASEYRFERFTFRTLLRLASKWPPVERLMFGHASAKIAVAK